MFYYNLIIRHTYSFPVVLFFLAEPDRRVCCSEFVISNLTTGKCEFMHKHETYTSHAFVGRKLELCWWAVAHDAICENLCNFSYYK